MFNGLHVYFLIPCVCVCVKSTPNTVVNARHACLYECTIRAMRKKWY
jgi:hypothetical protein